MMTAKEYLSQAFNLDHRINGKLEQVAALRALATKATSTLSDVPPSGSRNVQRIEDIICKIVDLENGVNEDIDHLVNLKADIIAIIKAVDHAAYQMLLELRYLCYKTWEQIAAEMGYELRWLHRLHGKALGEAEKLLHQKQATKSHYKTPPLA